jgi:hypothetical protein
MRSVLASTSVYPYGLLARIASYVASCKESQQLFSRKQNQLTPAPKRIFKERKETIVIDDTDASEAAMSLLCCYFSRHACTGFANQNNTIALLANLPKERGRQPREFLRDSGSCFGQEVYDLLKAKGV